MSKQGFRRLAKFGPGAELLDEFNHFIVMDVTKTPVGYGYKVLNLDSKEFNYMSPHKIEKMSFLGLVNVGNLRLLHGDVDGEEKKQENKTETKIRHNPDGTIQVVVTYRAPKPVEFILPTIYIPKF